MTTTTHTDRGPWLDREEAASYTRLSVETLAQMATRGTGPPYSKPSKRIVRYHVDDLDAWLRGAVRTSSADAPARK